MGASGRRQGGQVVRPNDILRLVRAKFSPNDPVRLLVEAWPSTMTVEEARIRAGDVLALLSSGVR